MNESTARLWTFEPLDSWFFRDGSPYNAGEGGQSGAGGLFPPFMRTLQGAVRIALAQGQGWTWDCDDRWPVELGTPDHLGEVTLGGPYVLREEDLLYPAPLYLMYKPPLEKGETRFSRLKPGETVESDIGFRKFPVASPRLPDAKVAEGLWLDRVGMERLLDGGVPAGEHVYRAADLWTEEGRTGLARDAGSRTAVTGQLYSCRHVRLREKVSLGVRVAGVPGEWHQKAAGTVPLGGEGRVAVCTVTGADMSLVPAGSLAPEQGTVRFTVGLLTPGRYGDVRRVVLEGPPGVPGHCVAACTGKLVPAGGWNSRSHEPLAMEPLVPAGSTWFFEADDSLVNEITALHGRNQGDPYGFGQILIGNWRD